MVKKPNAVPSPAKPTQEAKPEKTNKGRQVFGSVGSKDVNVYPFKVAIPVGFDFKTMKPLKKRDFDGDATYLEYRAAECTVKADSFKQQAELARKLGNNKDRQNAKRLVKLQEKMAELKKQLSDQGVDIEALLKTSDATAAA